MKHVKTYIILILLLFGSLAFVFAIDPCIQGFRVVFNEKEDIDCDDNSIVINENNYNKDIFVPTKTSAEWASFTDNSKRPDNVDIFYKETTTIPDINSDLNKSGEAIFFDGQFCVVWSEGAT